MVVCSRRNDRHSSREGNGRSFQSLSGSAYKLQRICAILAAVVTSLLPLAALRRSLCKTRANLLAQFFKMCIGLTPRELATPSGIISAWICIKFLMSATVTHHWLSPLHLYDRHKQEVAKLKYRHPVRQSTLHCRRALRYTPIFSVTFPRT